MDIAVGLPNAVPGATGADLLDWARRAEAAGFSSLASIGAVSYPSFEELTVFAAAGAVTRRIRFVTDILIAPARSAAELAKQAATVDQLTGGRLTLGLGVGWRASDYALTGRDYGRRGDRMDAILSDLAAAWRGEAIAAGTRTPCPSPVQDGGVPVLVGGTTDAAVRRVLEHGVGWTAGGLPPGTVKAFGARVREAWSDAGRPGSPRIVALAYFGLGDTEQRSRANVVDFYAPMGDDSASMIADHVLRSPTAIARARTAYEDAGTDELVLVPTVPDPAQVDLLADAVA